MARHSVGLEICSFGYLKNSKTYVGTKAHPDQISHIKEPFKGYAFNYYPNGNKELKGSYNRGLKDGKWTWWYPNGEKYKVGYYVKSMEDSIWEWWFSNGQLMKRGKYKNGKKEGRWSEWYENGKLASSFGYMDEIGRAHV